MRKCRAVIFSSNLACLYSEYCSKIGIINFASCTQSETGDAVFHVMQHLNAKEKINLQSITNNFRELLAEPQKRLRIVLTVDKISQPNNENAEFALENKLKIKIKFENIDDIQNMLDIIESPSIVQTQLLDQIEAFAVEFEINTYNTHTAQKCINLLGEKCPNLVSLSFGNIIHTTFILSADNMQHLTHLSFGHILFGSKVILTEMDQLTHLNIYAIQSLSEGVTFPSKMEKLTHLDIFIMDADVTLPAEMNNLVSLTLSVNAYATVTLPEKVPPKLTDFTFSTHYNEFMEEKFEEFNRMIQK